MHKNATEQKRCSSGKGLIAFTRRLSKQFICLQALQVYIYWWTDHSLVGVDPGAEEADSGVDRGAGGRAPGRPPRGRPHEGRAAHQGAPAVTLRRTYITEELFTGFKKIT